MPRWAAYFTVIGVIGSLLFGWIQSQPQLCAMGFGQPICLRAAPAAAAGTAPVTSEEPAAPVDPLDQLSPDVRRAVVAARQAQDAGRTGAAHARAAAARGDEAAQRARARQPGFGHSTSTTGGEWWGEHFAGPNTIVYGVRTEGGLTDRGEFRIGGAANNLNISAQLNVLNVAGGQYEGRSIGGGQWVGPGRFVFADGTYFEGVWRQGELTHGVLVYTDGRRYEGQFRDTHQYGFDLVQEGLGVTWSADGEVVRAGEWNGGNFVSAR